jgi:hypothetical protein
LEKILISDPAIPCESTLNKMITEYYELKTDENKTSVPLSVAIKKALKRVKNLGMFVLDN